MALVPLWVQDSQLPRVLQVSQDSHAFHVALKVQDHPALLDAQVHPALLSVLCLLAGHILPSHPSHLFPQRSLVLLAAPLCPVRPCHL